MRISISWLNELLDLPEGMTTKDLAHRLTMAGLEVEQIETIGEDTIFDVKITPNRPDALSHVGIARELAAILNLRTRVAVPACKESGISIHEIAQVTIKAKEACPRYACRVVDGIVVGESPDWVKERLQACGMRPVNNVVDATNLVMLERGQPLHAFDLDRLGKDHGRVHLDIRFAQKGEKLITLDGVERELALDDLVVSDVHTPQALAGVMGGHASEVGLTTTSVLIECAYFTPSVVRRMARRHGLSTEASYRFERGVDPNGVAHALERAAELISSWGKGRVRREAIDVYPRRIEAKEIRLRPQKLAEISGLSEKELDGARIRTMFLTLGIETIGKSGEALSFRAPTFRPDLTREIDLIEEAMRLIGLDKVPVRLSMTKRLGQGLTDEKFEFAKDKLQDTLITNGFFEATNFSFGPSSRMARFQKTDAPELIKVSNPLGEELSTLRQSLLPGLLTNLSFNLRHGASSIKLFEIGSVFLGTRETGIKPRSDALDGDVFADSWAQEKFYIAGVMVGNVSPHAVDAKARDADFFDLKGVICEMLSALHFDTGLMSKDLKFKRLENCPYLHPGVAASIWLNKEGQESCIGELGELHPDLRENFDLNQPAYLFELDLSVLKQWIEPVRIMTAIPRFPAIDRDLAILVDQDLSAEAIGDAIWGQSSPENLEDVRIFDVYRGKGIAEGKKSVALSFRFRSNEKTLEDSEVVRVMDGVTHRLKEKLSVEVR